MAHKMHFLMPFVISFYSFIFVHPRIHSSFNNSTLDVGRAHELSLTEANSLFFGGCGGDNSIASGGEDGPVAAVDGAAELRASLFTTLTLLAGERF